MIRMRLDCSHCEEARDHIVFPSVMPGSKTTRFYAECSTCACLKGIDAQSLRLRVLFRREQINCRASLDSALSHDLHVCNPEGLTKTQIDGSIASREALQIFAEKVQ